MLQPHTAYLSGVTLVQLLGEFWSRIVNQKQLCGIDHKTSVNSLLQEGLNCAKCTKNMYFFDNWCRKYGPSCAACTLYLISIDAIRPFGIFR